MRLIQSSTAPLTPGPAHATTGVLATRSGDSLITYSIMQLSYPTCFHYSYPDSDAQSSTLHTPLESPAYPSAYPPHQEHSEQQVKREKRKYRCRKRSPATIERARIVRRDKANARERRRMNSLNDALEHLRTILPSVPDEPKMTKIETLRVAQG
ncbi:Helix-loop-helix DNA-binding domain protein, partial [Ancylostoma duodenale]